MQNMFKSILLIFSILTQNPAHSIDLSLKSIGEDQVCIGLALCTGLVIAGGCYYHWSKNHNRVNYLDPALHEETYDLAMPGDGILQLQQLAAMALEPYAVENFDEVHRSTNTEADRSTDMIAVSFDEHGSVEASSTMTTAFAVGTAIAVACVAACLKDKIFGL